METAQILSMVYGALLMMMGWLLRRVFALLDELRREDAKLHSRITELATDSVSRNELQGSIDRVISHIDKMEERLLLK
jgi:hypothetical protein